MVVQGVDVVFGYVVVQLGDDFVFQIVVQGEYVFGFGEFGYGDGGVVIGLYVDQFVGYQLYQCIVC